MLSAALQEKFAACLWAVWGPPANPCQEHMQSVQGGGWLWWQAPVRALCSWPTDCCCRGQLSIRQRTVSRIVSKPWTARPALECHSVEKTPGGAPTLVYLVTDTPHGLPDRTSCTPLHRPTTAISTWYAAWKSAFLVLLEWFLPPGASPAGTFFFSYTDAERFQFVAFSTLKWNVSQLPATREAWSPTLLFWVWSTDWTGTWSGQLADVRERLHGKNAGTSRSQACQTHRQAWMALRMLYPAREDPAEQPKGKVYILPSLRFCSSVHPPNLFLGLSFPHHLQ